MEEQKKGGRGGGRCLSWRVVGVPDSADGNLMVLSCLCWISATCPTRVFLPLFSTLLFAPGGCISQALLPSGFSWAWLIASPGGMGRGREQWVQGVYFPNSLCKKAMLSWLCFFTKGDCSWQDSYSTQLPPFQFLVISPSYWAKASWILILGSFTFYRHLYLKKKKNPLLIFLTWVPHPRPVGTRFLCTRPPPPPVFPTNRQLNLKLDQIQAKHFSKNTSWMLLNTLHCITSEGMVMSTNYKDLHQFFTKWFSAVIASLSLAIIRSKKMMLFYHPFFMH